MQDRISNHPNRWVLTPVTGETNTYDFTRADDPTQVGTPLNKATFLTDSAASAVASLGVTSPDLPSEAIAAIAGILANMGVSDVGHVEAGSYVGTGTNSTSTYLDITFSITPRIVFIVSAGNAFFKQQQATGMIWMYDQTTANYAYNYNIQFVLNGKTLRRRVSNTNITAEMLMNASGTTYYYVGVGTK